MSTPNDTICGHSRRKVNSIFVSNGTFIFLLLGIFCADVESLLPKSYSTHNQESEIGSDEDTKVPVGPMPVFAEPYFNVTVPAGGEAKLSCYIKDMGSYKMKWIFVEDSTVLTMNDHVCTSNSRIKVSHKKFQKYHDWHLHISGAQKSDAGGYMCQISSKPAMTQIVYLRVADGKPAFIQPVEDIAVPVGTTVKLSCSVKNIDIKSHMIAWLLDDDVLAFHNVVVTKNPWFAVTLSRSKLEQVYTSYLHIANVQQYDTGRYKCHVTIHPPMVQFGYLQVVEPLGIEVPVNSFDVVVLQQSIAFLRCDATESPPPDVEWRRADDKDIRINETYTAKSYNGNTLHLSNVRREDAGVYTCTALNGIPSNNSKMFNVSVNFPPHVRLGHHLIVIPIRLIRNMSIPFECFTEAQPRLLSYWTKDGYVIEPSRKYQFFNEVGSPPYKTHMQLIVHELQIEDFGIYVCVVRNQYGEAAGNIELVGFSKLDRTGTS